MYKTTIESNQNLIVDNSHAVYYYPLSKKKDAVVYIYYSNSSFTSVFDSIKSHAAYQYHGKRCRLFFFLVQVPFVVLIQQVTIKPVRRYG